MAVEGRKLRQSIYQGSEEYCEFPCSPCSKEGRNVSAIKHCVDCDENFCTSCLKDHNKFSAMRGHEMLDKVQSPSGVRPQLPQQRCTKHGGKVIDVYCPGHNKVCCSTCIAVEHSSCHGIRYIPDVAKNIGTSNELKQFESKMANLKSRCISLSQSKDSDTQSLKQDKIKILGDIREFRKKVNDHIDKMERKLVDEADAKFKQKMNHVDSDKKEIQDVLDELKKTEQRLQAAKIENESDLFILLKTECGIIESTSEVVNNIESSGTVNRLQLTPEKKIEHVINEGVGIGEVDECYHTLVTSFYGEYNVQCENDTSKCNRIDGMCLCQGNVFLADCNNKRLKKLNIDYELISHLNMSDGPIGVCNVDNKEIAVTLINDKKVQFVSCTEPMKLLTYFHVGDRCRGIEYNAGILYVCCGGAQERNEGPGHLEIYRKDGTLIRSIYDMVNVPVELSASNDGSSINITFWEGGLAILGTYGVIAQQYQHKELESGSGICRLNEKLLCIARRESHNIALITNDGHFQQTLITQQDKIKYPMALCFDKKQSRLIVSSYDSKTIKVFQLSI